MNWLKFWRWPGAIWRFFFPPQQPRAPLSERYPEFKPPNDGVRPNHK